MSTRSSIAIELEDGSVKSVYCHYDGYPQGVGAQCLPLTRPEIARIISRGDMSSFGDHYVDRGEGMTKVGPKVYHDRSAWVQDMSDRVDFLYVITGDGKWYVRGCYDRRWTRLTENITR